MSRLACWVIVAGSAPTGFRADDRDQLLPTLRQLQRTQPDAALRWFEHGHLWESPLAAKAGLRAQREQARNRGRDWRPGGSHADPRARFKLTRDERRARFKQRLKRGKPTGTTSKTGSTRRPKPPSKKNYK